MSDALWWLPSLLVFVIAAGGVTAGVVALRRGAARRQLRSTTALRELERSAGSELVATDNEVQAAEDEVAFALAEFGPEAVGKYREAVATARRRLREAFLLQQRLDDSEPDTDEQRRSWNKQIVQLCHSAKNALDSEARDFSQRRAAERGAPAELTSLRARIASAEQRSTTATGTITGLAERYAEAALTPLRAALEGAKRELTAATAGVETASTVAARGEPVAELLAEAAAHLRATGRQFEVLDRAAQRIHSSEDAAQDAARLLRGDIDDARAVRDAHEDAEVAGRLNAAIAEATSSIDALTRVGRKPDPLAEVDGLRAASDALDAAASEARGLQQRIENARSAAVGALKQARSHIEAARDFMGGRRAMGSRARTRLAEAERQLALAEAEADPVARLDGARRASMHAIDADALARYDAGWH